MRALRVVGWLGLMLAATVPVVAQGLPAPTNPNLDHLGYYFTNERYGNQTAEAFPYTNLYVAVTDGYDTGVANWQGPLDASLAAAVAAGKDIFLMLVEKNQGSQVITWDDILDVAEPYWASVKYVEVAHEENLSAAQMDARISLLNTKLAARSLGGRSTVALFTTTTIFTTDALDSTALDLVGIEAYLDGPGSSTSSDNVNALNSYLEDAKDRVRSKGKEAILIMMAYDRGQWTNIQNLSDLQVPVYLNAYSDSIVRAILMFSFGRPGGSGYYSTLRKEHRRIACAMSLITCNATTEGDYTGDGYVDYAVYRSSTGYWYVKDQFAVQYGDAGDSPVPADYDGDGDIDVAIYRPSTGTWYVRNQFAIQFGDAGDIPVPADYDGDGDVDLAVYRPSNGTWYVRNQFAVQFGDAGDLPVPADYDGNGTADVAVYRPSTGVWYGRNMFATAFGDSGDMPVPADYDGDGDIDIAVYGPSTGGWYVRDQFYIQYGDVGDVPVYGDFTGDGKAEVAVYRQSTGTWYVRNHTAVQFGGTGDVAVLRR